MRETSGRLLPLLSLLQSQRSWTGTEPGAAMPPLLLDDEEAVAVVVGLRTGARGAISGVEEASLRALGKLEQGLLGRMQQRVGALQSAVVAATADGHGPAGGRQGADRDRRRPPGPHPDPVLLHLVVR